MKRRAVLLAAISAATLALPAAADIFKCVDDDGHVTYANAGGKGCKKLSAERVTTVPAAKAPAGAAATGAGNGFPKVDPAEQRSRDGDRRRILESELDTEQQALDKARKELADQEEIRVGGERNYQRVLDRLKPFQDQVALHERNIEAIRKELSNLR